MTRQLPLLQIERNRHGKRIYYVRAGRGPRIRIPDGLDRTSFLEAYRAAVAGLPIDAPSMPPRPDQASSPNREVRHSYVYVMTDGYRMKVGRSHNPAKRRDQLAAGNAEQLRVLKKVRVPVSDVARIEQTAHRLLDGVRVDREWFRCTSQQALDAILASANGTEFEITPVEKVIIL